MPHLEQKTASGSFRVSQLMQSFVVTCPPSSGVQEPFAVSVPQ